MDWSYILDIIMRIVISLATTIITTGLGIIFGKLLAKIKDSRIMKYVKEAVMAAEQLYPNQGVKRGTEKYDYVVQLVLAKFPKLQNNAYLKSLIEGAVYALNNELLKQQEKEKLEKQAEQIVIKEEKKESKSKIIIQ